MIKSKLLINSDILCTFKESNKVILEVDASPTGVGAVLIQLENDKERPVAFASKKLSPAENNYSQIDREALALVFGVTKFKHYLLGRHFELRTDHRPLLGLFNNNKNIPIHANARIIRWTLILSQFSYDIVYKSGKSNYVADLLSRLPISDSLNSSTPTEYVKLINAVDYFDVSFKDIQKCTFQDDELVALKAFIKLGFPNDSAKYFDYAPYKNELSLFNDVILYKNRILIPAKLRPKILNMLHASHNGIVAMKEEARSFIWWPHIDNEIQDLTKNCEICFKNFKPNNEPVMNWPNPGKPWSRLHIDYCGPVDGKFFLVIVDAYSKFFDVHVTNCTTSLRTMELLRKSFSNYGLPDVVVSDNAAYFVSSEIKDFYAKNNVKLITPAPYNPSTNGLAERAVQTLKSGLVKFKEGSIETRLARFLYNYRSSVHSGTKASPAEMMFGRKFKSPLDVLKPKSDHIEKESSNSNADKLNDKHFVMGEAVFAKNYNVHSNKKWLPGEIIEVLGFKNYKVKVYDNGHFIWRRHISQLIPRSLPLDDLLNKGNNKTIERNDPILIDIPISNYSNNTNLERSCLDSSECHTDVIQPTRRSCRISKPPQRLDL